MPPLYAVDEQLRERGVAIRRESIRIMASLHSHGPCSRLCLLRTLKLWMASAIEYSALQLKAITITAVHSHRRIPSPTSHLSS